MLLAAVAGLSAFLGLVGNNRPPQTRARQLALAATSAVKTTPPAPRPSRGRPGRREAAAESSSTAPGLVRLPGEVIPALASVASVAAGGAFRPEPVTATDMAQPTTITLTLRRADQAGFDAFVSGVTDPRSRDYRHFLSQRQLAERFGPTEAAYGRTIAWLRAEGLRVVQGSANRLTITAAGTRAQIERALHVRIGDFRSGRRAVYANTTDPALPAPIARSVQAVSGLSDLGMPTRSMGKTCVESLTASNVQCTVFVCGLAGAALSPYTGGGNLFEVIVNGLFNLETTSYLKPFFATVCGGMMVGVGVAGTTCFAMGLINPQWHQAECDNEFGYGKSSDVLGSSPVGRTPPHRTSRPAGVRSSIDPDAEPGSNPQKIGLLEFDTFHESDVADWLSLLGGTAPTLGGLSEVPVNGGVASPGPGESEVLLDIDTSMLFDSLPGTQYVVYDAPPSTSFQTMFNAMINDGDTVISNSWSECEDQVSQADAESIDSILAQAAASGISVFNGSGDSGSTCLDGSQNTIGVPADSPHATAVGGSSPTPGPGYTYGSETWWNGSTHTPPTGQGGFGVSKYFSRPAYQNGLNSSPMRSVPDVVADADPADGMQICQADAGGCPTGGSYGGTSMSAPEWAGITAFLNDGLGHNIGEANPVLYSLAGTQAFHSAESMGSDFAHVGLGSFDLEQLRLELSGESVGAVDPSRSIAAAAGPEASGPTQVQADGKSEGTVEVTLRDSGGFPVAGKTVSVTPSTGSAHVSAASGPSDDDGVVTFTVTDTAVEKVTFTVKDETDGITLDDIPELDFTPPVAAGAEISASPTDLKYGGPQTTISVYLENALGRPAAGKTVKLADGESYAEITPSDKEAETDAEGVATFTASDPYEETISFTATDVTDGNLPVPGSATVTFEEHESSSCSDASPVPISGFSIAPWVSGIPYNPQSLDFPGVEFYACQGPAAPAFNASGNAYVSDSISGEIYVLGLAGGSVGTAGKLPNAHFPDAELGQVAFGKEGALYAGLGNTNGDFYEPEVVQLDPATGEVLRVLATSTDGLQICPYNIAVDPLSGDVFTTDSCTGAAGKHPSDITRIENPASASPTVSDYVNLPSHGGVQSSGLAFAPDGTLFVALQGGDEVVRIAGTNKPEGERTPTTVATLSGEVYGVSVASTNTEGEATALDVTVQGGEVRRVDLTKSPPESETIASSGGDLSGAALGPDGCVYISDLDRLLRLSGSSGCTGPATGGPEIALTSSGPSPAPTGTSVTFTAQLQNFSSAANTPVTFIVTGANGQVKLVHANSSGAASFNLPGVLTGGDEVQALATAGASAVQSAPLAQRWSAGKDVTFLSLSGSQESGVLGQPATFTVSLADISTSEPSPIAGASVQIAVAGQSCVVTTDSSGVGSCTLAPPGGQALDAVTATYEGSASYTPSTASSLFAAGGVGIEAMVTPTPSPSPSPSSSPSPTPPPTTPTSTVVKKAPVRPLAEVLGLPPATQCVSKRELVVHVHAPPGQKLLSVKLSLRGKVLRSLKYTKGHGHKIPSTVVDLKGLPKGTYTLKIVVHTKSGKTYTATRTYHTCVPKKTRRQGQKR